MTKIKTLKNWNEDHTKRESIAPRTHIKAVYDNNGNTLDSLMAVQDEKLSELGSKVDSVQKNMEQDIYQEFVDVEKNNYYGEYAINSLGEISSNSDCSTYRIPVKEGDTISIYGLGSVVHAALSFSEVKDPESVTMVMMHASESAYYTYKAPLDGYVFASFGRTSIYKRILHTKRESIINEFGIINFTFGTNALQRLVCSDVTDESIWGVGYINSSGNVINGSSYYYTKVYIPILSGNYISRLNFGSNARICFYNKDKELIGSFSSGNATESRFRVFPEGAVYMRISLNGADTSHLSMVYQEKGGIVTDIDEINKLNKDVSTLDYRVSKLESDIQPIENNLQNEFNKLCNAGWTVRDTYKGSFEDLTEEVYGSPNIQYNIPIDQSAKVLHIKFDFKLTNGKLQYVSNSTNQEILSVGGTDSYRLVFRQYDSEWWEQDSILRRRQMAVALQGSNYKAITMDCDEYEGMWGEIAYTMEYKGEDFTTAYEYLINLSDSRIEIRYGDVVLETIIIDDGESLESIINKINSNSNYLVAKPYEIANVLWSDCFMCDNIPLCAKTEARVYPIRNLNDTKWHTIEAIIDYNKLMSWTNVDGRTISNEIAEIDSKNVYIGGQAVSSIGMSPFTIRNLHIGFSYEDAEIITYPDNVSGTITRLISNDNPYLMIFEGHGIEDITNSQEPLNDMSASTDRLRCVFEILKGKGFVPVSWEEVKKWRVNGYKLPKRCYTLMFDDFRIDNYMNNDFRKPFVQFGVKPGLAIITGIDGETKSRDTEVVIDGETWTYGECFDAIIKGGWYPCSHTKNHTIIGKEISSENLLQFAKDCIYSCNRLGIYNDILVYPRGSINSSLRALMGISGFSLGVSVAENGYNCRMLSKYKIIRNEIGQRASLESVLSRIV